MIKTVTVINQEGDSLELELTRPQESGFIVKPIDGLGPVKANINMNENASGDGARYNSARVGARNIVLTLAFNETHDIETSRQLTYKIFPVKKIVEIILKTDNRHVRTYGKVESNEPDIFSKEESTVISILCEDPYFHNASPNEEIVTSFSAVVPMFEFPFSNESIADKLLIMGELLIKQEQTITYEGDVDTGVIVYIHAIGSATSVQIYNTETLGYISIDTTKLAAIVGGAGGIIDGDDIIINTRKGQKSITHIRGGVERNILNAMNLNADWFTIKNGDNVFAYTAATGATNLQVSFLHRASYQGV